MIRPAPAPKSREVAADSGHLAVINAAAAGDQSAFRQIYNQYSTPVFNLVFRCMRNRQSAEDVCQEVWVRAYRELPKLRDHQAFAGWLYRIAARACVDAARRNGRTPAVAHVPDEILSTGGSDPEKSALERERISLTWQALASLPARQHVALFLKEFERHSYREIADMLKTSESAVETLLFRARSQFAKAYRALEGATHERCRQAGRSMSALVDGEATPVQQVAVRTHVDACQPCATQLAGMRRASTAYASLATVPVSALVGERIFQSIGVATPAASASATGGLAKLGLVASAKVKVAAFSVVATASITAAAVASPVGPDVPFISNDDGTLPASSELPAGRFDVAVERPVDAGIPAEEANVAGNAETTQPDAPGEASEPPLVEGLPAAPALPESAADPLIEDVSRMVSDTTLSVDIIVHEVVETVEGAVPLPVGSADVTALPTLPPVEPPPAPTVPPLPLP